MKLRPLLICAAAATSLAFGAPATAQSNWSQDRLTAWQQIQSTHVSAHTVLGGDISNGLHEIADVDDLILSPDGQRVQYVLFDLRGPFDTIDGRNGFADWTTLDVDNGTLGDVELVLSPRSTAKGAQELALTAAQANRRLVSNLLASELTFADGQVRQIEDVLFHPETGEVQDYVVEMSPDAVLSTDERRVPADWVRADANGGLRVTQPATYQYEVWII